MEEGGEETIDVDKRHFEDFVEIIKDADDDRRRNKDDGGDNQSVGGMSSQSQNSNRSNRDFWIQKEQQQINNDNNVSGGTSVGTSSVASGGSSNQQQQQQNQNRRFRRGKKKPSKHGGDSLDGGSSHSVSTGGGGSVYSSTSQEGNYNDNDNDDNDSYQKDFKRDDDDDDVMDLAVANDITKIYTANTDSSSPRKSGAANYEPAFHDSFYDSMDFWADKDKRISSTGGKSPRTPGGRRKFVKPNSFNGGGDNNNIGFMLSPTRTPGSGSGRKFVVNKSKSVTATAVAEEEDNIISADNNNYQAKLSTPNKSLSLSSSSKPPPLLSQPGNNYQAKSSPKNKSLSLSSTSSSKPPQPLLSPPGGTEKQQEAIADRSPQKEEPQQQQQQQQQQEQDEMVKGVSDDSEGGVQQQDEMVKAVSDDSEGGGAISPPPLNTPTNKQKKSPPPPSTATTAATTSSDQQQQQQQQEDAGTDQKQQQQQQQQDAGTVATTQTIYSLTPPQTPEQQFEKTKIPGGGGGGGGSSISSGSATKTPKTPKKSKSAATPKTPKSSTPKVKPKTPKSSSSSTPKKSKSAGARSSNSNNTPKSTPKRRKMKTKDSDIVDKEKDNNKRSETSPITRSPRSRSKSKEREGKRSTTPPRSPRSKSKERGKRSTTPPRSPRSKSKERGKRSTTPPMSPKSPKMEKYKYSAAGEKSKSPKSEKKGKSRDVTPPRTRPKSPIVDKKGKLSAAVPKSPRKSKNVDNEFDVAAAAAKSPKSRKERKLGKKKNSKRNLLTDDTDSADEISKNSKSKKNNKEGGEGGETTTTKKKKNKKQSSKRNLMADVDSLEGSLEAAAAGTPPIKSKKDKKDKKKDRQKKTPRKSNQQEGANEEAAAVVSANIHDLLSHMEKSTTLLVSNDEGDGDNDDYNASGNLSFGSVSFDSNPEKKKQNTATTEEKEIDETTSDEVRAFKEKGGDGAYPVPLTETTPKQKGKRPGQKHVKKKQNVRKDESADDDDHNEETKPKHPPVRFKNVQGESLFSPKKTYKPPVFKKSIIEQEMIEKSFKKNPAFEGIVQSTQKRLIDAFEKVEVDKGATVAEEGGKEDKLFVVQEGEVSFHNRGIQIGTGEVGSTFGQMALKLPVQREVEVKAERDHTVLFQLDHNNYREILRYETTREEEKRRELLRDVPFFKDATDSDLKQLGNAMKSYNFKKGDNLTELYAESPFCLVVKGSLSIKDKEGTVGSGTEVGPGEVFGEEIFSSEDVKRVHIQALTDGRACTITREEFEKVFGDMGRIAGKARDKKILSEIKSIKAAKLSDADMDALVRQISNLKYESHENIFTIDEKITPALYLVRMGKVEIIKRNGTKETKVAGEYFGHYHVISAEEGGGGHHTVPSSVKAKYTAAPVGDTVCAVLTLQELATIVAGTAGQVPEELDQGPLVPFEDLVQHRILGEGQFGIVWLVTNRNDERMEPYALKVQEVDDPNRPDSRNAIRKEVETMKALRCPFIVQIFCTYENPDSISMLLSVAPGGELFDLVHQEDEDGMWHSGLQEPHASFFATVIADVMAFMHHQRYLYRDLKPENVLIDQDGYPVITDFGFAKHMEGDADTKTYTFCGTPQYLCPEITLHHGHSYPADNWTIGVLIYELILGENPFFEPGVDSTILYDTICNKPPFFDESDPISEEAKSLIFRLLEKDPNKRLGTFREKDILEDPWLSQYKVSKLRAKKVAAPWVPDPVEFEEI